MDGMYPGTLRERIAAWYDRVWRRGVLRSGMATGVVLAVAVLGLGLAYHEHMQGNLHKFKAKMETQQQDAPVPRPGGQEAIMLLRTRLTGDSTPQFLSATLLPGRGMNMLQIRAYIPGKGEVDLLASPSTEDAATAMTGKGADANGQASLALGSPFEVPWAGEIFGTPTVAEGRINAAWRGHWISLPAATPGGAFASGGLMLAVPQASAGTTSLPDGGQAQATFDVADASARWPSKTRVTVTVLLSSRSIELTVVALNTGDTAEPVGIGWNPRFAIPDGHREQLLLHIPSETRAELRQTGESTGSLLPVAGTPYDFSAREGVKLGAAEVNQCFVALRQNLLDSGPVAELRDPEDSYGLRLTALTPTIKAMAVRAPAGANSISIEPRYNYPDPLGREWAKQADTGMVVLQPGESTEWKARLELFPLADSGSGL